MIGGGRQRHARHAAGARGQSAGQGVRRRRRDGSGPYNGGGHSCLAQGAAGTQAPLENASPAEPPAALPAVSPAAPAEAAATRAERRRVVAVVAKPDRCILCESCLDACPRGAISLGETATIDTALCTGCGICVEMCSYGVLALGEG